MGYLLKQINRKTENPRLRDINIALTPFLPLLIPHLVDDLEDLGGALHDHIVNPKIPVAMLDLVRMPSNTFRLEDSKQ